MSAPHTTFRLGLLGQIAMNVADTGRSVEFYRDTLGIPFLFEFPKLAFFDCGGVRLMLSAAPEQAGKQHASILYFRVEEIRAAHRTLAARGVKFVDEPHLVARLPDHELWMTFFEDPDGNLLALMTEWRGAPGEPT